MNKGKNSKNIIYTFRIGIFGWDSDTCRDISAIFGDGEGFGMGVKADCVIADVTIDADVAELKDRHRHSKCRINYMA